MRPILPMILVFLIPLASDAQQVGRGDLLEFSLHWRSTENETAFHPAWDFTADGQIDSADLLDLIARWHTQPEPLRLLLGTSLTVTAVQEGTRLRIEPGSDPAPGVAWILDGTAALLEGREIIAVHTTTDSPALITAVSGELRASRDIEVLRPAALGHSHPEVDAVVLDMADLYGVPPQLIKGQMHVESGALFDRTAYRYEPGFDYRYISVVQYFVTSYPYNRYRLATPAENGHVARATGSLLLPEDVAPRLLYTLRDANGDGYLSAYEYYDFNPGQNWPARPAVDFTAQTAISSSYGYMQVLWTTAVAPLGWNGGHGGNPSALFDAEVNIGLGVHYNARNFTYTGDWWQDWKDALARYNPGSPTYADKVLERAKFYPPREAAP